MEEIDVSNKYDSNIENVNNEIKNLKDNQIDFNFNVKYQKILKNIDYFVKSLLYQIFDF